MQTVVAPVFDITSVIKEYKSGFAERRSESFKEVQNVLLKKAKQGVNIVVLVFGVPGEDVPKIERLRKCLSDSGFITSKIVTTDDGAKFNVSGWAEGTAVGVIGEEMLHYGILDSF